MDRQEMFRIGWQAGYNQGYMEGFDAGYEAGFERGKSFGYNEGHAAILIWQEEVLLALRHLRELLFRRQVDLCGASAGEARKLIEKLGDLELSHKP
ncbi:hypothetical protein [Thermodesulfitimonas sp.]